MASTNTKGLQSFLVRNPETGTFSLYSGDQGLESLIPEAPVAGRDEFPGERPHVLILGGGISGLTAAYDLLKNKFNVTIIEATKRTGGRSLTLRDDDEFTEVNDEGKTWTQKCTLITERVPGGQPKPYPAYLNAGPGRIPSAHYHVLNLCKELKVDLEVYIMNTRSNLIKAGAKGPMVYRRLYYDTIGIITDELYQHLTDKPISENQNYLELLRNLGSLSPKKDSPGYYYKGSQRSGYKDLPGTNAGIPIDPIKKEILLESGFWKNHFYQPDDFLWQQTSFQPVGGMDMIEKALVVRIKELGGRIVLNAPVNRVMRTADSGWEVHCHGITSPVKGDICLCNIPIPLMKDKLKQTDFQRQFWDSFSTVMNNKEFLQPTCKVGWQAKRELWQKLPTSPNNYPVIPIFGGISYSTHPMTQMWYPSDRFHDQLGVLTGAYNYEKNAIDWGKKEPKERLEVARDGARQLHGDAFADGLINGITIAWQNIPTQKGGWADWSKVAEKPEEQARIMNTIRGGDNNFYVIGDQVSWLPGWKEGAVAVAQEIYAKITGVPDFEMLQIDEVPDTRSLIQGHIF